MSHFLQDVEITNFKSIRHQKIEGCRRVNVFIGAPNVGKSNILEAIGCAGIFHQVDLPGSRVISQFIRVESSSEIFFEGDWSELSSIVFNQDIAFRFDYNPPYKDLTLSLFFDRNGEWYFQGELTFNQHHLSDNARERHKMLLNRELQIGLGDDKIQVKRYTFTPQPFPDNYGTGSLTFPYGENLMRVLIDSPQLRKELINLFEQYHLRPAFDKSSASIKFVREHSDGMIFLLPYSLAADTIQRLMFYKAAIATNENAVLLFEEPEAHMFPPYIKLFTNDIIDKKSNQYFLATHSPFVLHEFLETHAVREELSIYAVGLQNGETTIKRLTDEEVDEVYQYGVDLFFNIESYVQ